MEKITKYQKALNKMISLGKEQCDICIENFIDILYQELSYKGSYAAAVEWWKVNKNNGAIEAPKSKRKYKPAQHSEWVVWDELTKVYDAKAAELGRVKGTLGAWIFDNEVDKQLIKGVANKLNEEYRRVKNIFDYNTGA